MRTPIRFSSFHAYTIGTWIVELLAYFTGVSVRARTWRLPGLWTDLYTFYHRGRYGWAPRDVWNLDQYLERVLSQTLQHLADTTNAAPAGYPFTMKTAPVDDTGNPITDVEQWRSDLRRWARSFADVDVDELDELVVSKTWGKIAKQRQLERTRTLVELAKWWEGLWD